MNLPLGLRDAQSLLELARSAQWQFPSSSGSPVKRRDNVDGIVAELFERRDALPNALHTLIETEDSAAAMELAARTWRLWMMDGDHAGGRDFLAMVLDGESLAHTRWLALGLYGDGLFAFWLGDLNSSRTRNLRALDVAKAADDAEATALANLGLSRVEFETGSYAAALEYAQTATELGRRISEAMTQAPLHMTAQSTRLLGRFDEASVLFAESLELNRRLGDMGMMAVELHNGGHVEVHRGNASAAERLFAEAAELDTAGDDYGRAMIELNKGSVAYARNDLERARAQLHKAQGILSRGAESLAADDQFELDWLSGKVNE